VLDERAEQAAVGTRVSAQLGSRVIDRAEDRSCVAAVERVREGDVGRQEAELVGQTSWA
jgi:hypothetical protein